MIPVCPCHARIENDIIRYYKDKLEIANSISYNSIIEIGVGAGYGAHAFLSTNPDAEYTGYEIGYFDGAGDWHKKLLSNFNYKVNIVDSQSLSTLGKNADLVHVDGDHTDNGAYHDCVLALDAVNRGGYILIDDYIFIPDVKKGVDRFVERYHNWFEYVKYLPTLRGDVLMRVL